MTAPAFLRSQILAAAAATPSLTRTRARQLGVVLLAASIAVGITVFEGIGGLSHSSDRPLGITLALAGGWAVVSAVLTWLVVGRAGSTLSRSPLLLLAAALAAPILVFVWTQLFSGTYQEPFARVGYRCLAYTLLISAVPLASFLALRRGVEPRYPGALGAAAGAACAAWAGSLIDLWCPLTNVRHVLVGHVAPLLVAMAIGALAGRFMLGFRRVRTR